jgi:hypothetical protein
VDIKDGEPEPKRAVATPPRPVAPTDASGDETAPEALPFAKPVKADKKRKKR